MPMPTSLISILRYLGLSFAAAAASDDDDEPPIIAPVVVPKLMCTSGGIVSDVSEEGECCHLITFEFMAFFVTSTIA